MVDRDIVYERPDGTERAKTASCLVSLHDMQTGWNEIKKSNKPCLDDGFTIVMDPPVVDTQSKSGGTGERSDVGTAPKSVARHISYTNGDYRVEYADKSGYSHNQDGKGGYEEKHWGPKAQDNYYRHQEVVGLGNVSREFVAKVGNSFAKLSKSDRDLLSSKHDNLVYMAIKMRSGLSGDVVEDSTNGVRIVAAGSPTDVHPREMLQVLNANFPRQPEELPGYYMDGTIVVAETYKYKGLMRKVIDPEQTLRHEVGHAIDWRIGIFSRSQEFVDAYKKDMQHLPAGMRAHYAYFLQPRSGATEAFAELYGSLRGNSRFKRMQQDFPECTKILASKLMELEAKAK